MATLEQRQRMAAAIVEDEARRDAAGNLTVYVLPAGDGGGTYEVAGINDRYHPRAAAALKELLGAGKYDEAEKSIVTYLIAYTNSVTAWHDNAGVEYFNRDTAFNRGPTGALRILQRAVGAPDDGKWGPLTQAAVAKFKKPSDLLGALRAAREQYERDVVKRDESSAFWAGLTNRWNKVYARARTFSDESPSVVPTAPVAPAAPAPRPKAPQAPIRPAPTPTVLQRLPGPLGALVGLIRWRKLPCLASPQTRPTVGATTLAPPSPKRTSGAPTESVSPLGAIGDRPWYIEAQKHVGFHETGVNQGIEWLIEGAKSGSVKTLLGQPWCAVYVNYCTETVGLPGSGSAMARSFEKSPHFVRLDGPAIGAIGTLWRGSQKAGTGHVFFYAGHDDKGTIGLGGNQSDGVSYAYEDMDRHTGWWWPKGQPLPAVGEVRVSGIKALSKRSET